MTKEKQQERQSSSHVGIILDTHIWIWLANASEEVSQKTIKMIDNAGQQGQLFISAISVWEIATLVAKKRISLNVSIQEWVKKSFSQPGLKLIPLSPDIAVESASLPDDFHGDPADRIIVASARCEHLTLITRDQKILDYGKKGHLLSVKA